MMKKFFEAGDRTFVDAYAVTAVQGRLSNPKDQYGDTASGVITIYTHGGNILVPSNNVEVDLEALRAKVEELAVPQFFTPPATTNVTNISGVPSSGHE
jgi:hypothetical protein